MKLKGEAYACALDRSQSRTMGKCIGCLKLRFCAVHITYCNSVSSKFSLIGSSATTQAIGLAVGVALPVVFSIALFCIVFCISKRSRRILASGPARHQTHASSNATTVHRIQPMSNPAYGQHVDQTRYGQHPQPMDNPTYNMHALPAVSNGVGGEATPPTYQETLVSAEPPSYDAVQENKDLYNVSLPPSYPAGPPNPQHLPS